MWPGQRSSAEPVRAEYAKEDAHAPRGAPSAAPRSLWTYDPRAMSRERDESSTHGVIGSGTAPRSLWRRSVPEQEEREEEALPSYLSYLQPTLDSVIAPALRHDAKANAYAPPNASRDSGAVESKSKDLLRAFDSYIRAQVAEQQQQQLQQEQQQRDKAEQSQHVAQRSKSCDCDHLQRQVTSLEATLKTVQDQLALLTTNGAVVGSAAAASPTATSSSSSSSSSINNGLSDRVSTLEGRQSAFQSQLAQISRVLGIPGVQNQGSTSQYPLYNADTL